MLWTVTVTVVTVADAMCHWIVSRGLSVPDTSGAYVGYPLRLRPCSPPACRRTVLLLATC